MISIDQVGSVYSVSFPYDQTLISYVKSVPGRRWNPNIKKWIIPSDKLGFFISQIRDTSYINDVNIQSTENININAPIESTKKIPDIDISDVEYYVHDGLHPFKHQLEFMKFAIDRQQQGNLSGFILADQPGLTKTNCVMNLSIYNRKKLGFKHVLIICCINSAKYHWKADIEYHTNNKFSPYILGTRLNSKGLETYVHSSKDKYEDLCNMTKYGDKNGEPLPYFIVTNIESLRYSIKKKHPISDKIIELIKSGEIGMIAVDEIHKNASPSSIQGRQLLGIKDKTDVKCMWIPMTGTPITSKPTDVYLPLKLVDGHNFTSYYMWSKKFCIYGGYGNHAIVAYKNIDYLKQLLENHMLRRLKSDVLDLPDKLYHMEYVENTNIQNKLYNEVADEIIKDRDNIVKSLNPLAKMLKLRQVNGNPELVDGSIMIDSKYISKNSKMQKLLEILEDIHERKEKVVIFSNWVQTLRMIYKLTNKKYNVCYYTGTMKESDRERQKDLFINNPSYTILIGTIGALGTMHNLQVSNNVIFYDEPWNATDKEQAEDRCHRADSKLNLNIYTIITKNTIDERVHDILYNKDQISKYIVDNIDIYNDHSLFDKLMIDNIPNRK